jgi:hypothetical protein
VKERAATAMTVRIMLIILEKEVDGLAIPHRMMRSGTCRFSK